MVDSVQRPIFEVTDVGLDAAPASVLGVWRPVLVEEVVTFGPDAAPTAPTWRANLPPDLGLAGAMLEQRLTRLDQSERALAGMQARLATPGSIPAWQDDELVTFSPGGVSALLTRLTTALSALWPGELAAQFDPRALLDVGWEEAARQFQSVRDTVMRSVTTYAWVVTSVDQRAFARTRVVWGGDTTTFTQVGLSVREAELHQQTLALALRTRSILLRTFVVALQIAVAVGTGNPIVLLPIAWRQINRLFDTLG